MAVTEIKPETFLEFGLTIYNIKRFLEKNPEATLEVLDIQNNSRHRLRVGTNNSLQIKSGKNWISTSTHSRRFVVTNTSIELIARSTQKEMMAALAAETPGNEGMGDYLADRGAETAPSLRRKEKVTTVEEQRERLKKLLIDLLERSYTESTFNNKAIRINCDSPRRVRQVLEAIKKARLQIQQFKIKERRKPGTQGVATMAILRSIEDTSPRQFQILKDLDRDQTGAYGIICDADREVIYIVNHSAALDLATR